MSSGAYALLGVVLGGLVTLLVQGGLSWWQAKRADKAEWRVANRLLTDELLRLMLDMKAMIDAGVIGEGFAVEGGRRWFDTTLWEQYRAVIARHLPDSDAGDDFWRGIARINGVAPTLRHLGTISPAGTELPPQLVTGLVLAFEDAARAYEALTGVPPAVEHPVMDPPAAQSP